ncbi:MAG: hypothetical protein H7039_00460 [Bryobacteraceae bacterium]|nr:hypothetical protein [Bryobacteraceae bacterium]
MAENTDINARAVTGTGIAMFFGTVVITLALWFFFEYIRERDASGLKPRENVAPVFRTIRQPVLQTSPSLDMEAMRRKEDEILNGGDGRLPIEKAMEEVARRGVPAAAKAPEGMLIFTPRSGRRETGFESRGLLLSPHREAN